MRFFNDRRAGWMTWVVGLAVLLFVSTGADRAQAASKLLKEAKKLAALEKDYFAKRKANQWKSLYAYQHPRFQKTVSQAEYRFFEGRVLHDYRDKTNHHVSGGSTPTLAYIKKNPKKKDLLGFPVTRTYRWFSNSFMKVNGYSLDKVSISQDGRYAMVAVKLKAKEQLNPAMVRGLFEFDVEEPHIDYWEKVKGRWRIALLAHAASISGSKVKYFIPRQSSHWEKKKFIHFKAASLEKRKPQRKR